MQKLHIHILSAGAQSLDQCGVYRYAETARILLVGFAFGAEPIAVHDCTAGLPLPQRLVDGLQDQHLIKVAHNANIARTLITACWQIDCPPEQWRCSYSLALALAIPSKREDCASFFGLTPQPEPRGRQLLSRFCMPQRPTAVQRKLWVGRDDFPNEWEALKGYMVSAVACERDLFKKLLPYDLLLEEWRLWALDQRMNDAGVAVDMPLVQSAIKIADQRSASLLTEALNLTGIKNPNSIAQLQRWLLDEHNESVASLNKSNMPGLLQRFQGSAQRVLQIRQQLGKSSIQKFHAIQRSVCKDGRVRGLLQFMGAQRTGRWAGRLVQIQNLPKNTLKDLDLARRLVGLGDVETLEILYGNVPDVLSELIRSAFVSPIGKRLIISDFSAIEARVLAWGAGESWRIEVFQGHGKIYEASASAMFNVAIERIVEGNPEYALRQKGKVAELALGYNGGTQALINMGALDMGLQEIELPSLVTAWRKANPAITGFWRKLEREATTAVANQSTAGRFIFDTGFLFMNLPSGRRISYPRARLADGHYGPKLQYWGKDSKSHQWQWLETYGGKLVENWCQAVARDVLREALFAVEAAGIGRLLFTVHDEIVLEGNCSAREIEALMARDIPWAPGLPLSAKAFTSAYYKKD